MTQMRSLKIKKKRTIPPFPPSTLPQPPWPTWMYKGTRVNFTKHPRPSNHRRRSSMTSRPTNAGGMASSSTSSPRQQQQEDLDQVRVLCSVARFFLWLLLRLLLLLMMVLKSALRFGEGNFKICGTLRIQGARIARRRTTWGVDVVDAEAVCYCCLGCWVCRWAWTTT